MTMFKLSISFAVLALLSLALAAPIKHRRADISFAADKSINVQDVSSGITAIIAKSKLKAIDSYPVTTGDKSAKAEIFKLVIAKIEIYVIPDADMDVDCDGVDVSRHRPSHILTRTDFLSISINAKYVTAV